MKLKNLLILVQVVSISVFLGAESPVFIRSIAGILFIIICIYMWCRRYYL